MPAPSKKIGFVLGVSRERDTLIVRLDENVEHEDIVEGNFVSIPLANGNTLIGRVTTIRAENPQLSDERYAKFWMDRLRKSLESRSMLEFTEFHIIEVILVSNISFDGELSTPNAWVSPGSMVFDCRDDLLELAVFGKERGAMEIGTFAEHSGEIIVKLNPNVLGSDGLAIFGSRGSGKSYAAGVILEEFAEFGLPILVVDPHGEYWGLSHTMGPKGNASLPKYHVKVLYPNKYTPRYFKYMKNVSSKLDTKHFTIEPITMLFSEISVSEMFSFTYDLTSTQKEKIENTWYAIRDKLGYAVCYDIDGFLGFGIENGYIDGSSIRPIVRKIEVFRKMGFFTDLSGAICHTGGSIIMQFDNKHRRIEREEKKLEIENLSTVRHNFGPEQITILDISQPTLDERARRIFVSSYLNRLRKTMEAKQIQRIFLLIEEAHRFIPIGESPTKRSIEWFAREGRKMGAGLGVVSQRPSGLDRDILSQCNSKLFLRITEQSDMLVAKDILAGFAERYVGLLPYLERGTGVLSGAALRIPILVSFRERKSSSRYGETVALVADPTSKAKSRKAETKDWKK